MTPFHLPIDYIENHSPSYHADASLAASDVIYQPEVYAVADWLMKAKQRSAVIDIGCGNARKLHAVQAGRHIGVDFGDNIDWCRAHYPNWGEWVETDLAQRDCIQIADLVNEKCMVVCADVIEHLVDPSALVELLAETCRRGAIVITSTPDRVRVRGVDHRGPPGNPSHVREWALDEYTSFLASRGLPAVYAGYTINNNIKRERKTIITIHDRIIDRAIETMSPSTLEMMTDLFERRLHTAESEASNKGHSSDTE